MTQIVSSLLINDFISGNGLSDRKRCRVATVSAGTLATAFQTGSTIDGVTLALNDRILIKDQALPSENGIYIVQAGAPYRAPDLENGSSASGIKIRISAGSVNSGRSFYCSSTQGSDIVGTNSLIFTQDGDVTLTGAQTLTNKTLTAPVISTIINTGTLTLPTATDTLVGRATTDTLTNKTLSTGSVWNGSAITVPFGGTGATSLTGVLIGNGVSAVTTKTNPTGAFVGDTDTQTLTNKTLTAPIISTIVNTGTLTLPTTTDTLVGRATTDTLTNKTLTSPAINGGTINNATVGATTAATGRFTTVAATNTTNQFAIGTTNITTLNYPAGAGAITLTFPNTADTMVGRATTDTLTNKTLTSPTINTATISGGTINNASVGATTASTGRFTTVAITNTTNQMAIGTTNITTLNYPAPSGAITLTFPITTDTMVGRATTDTLTNKTLTSPVLNSVATLTLDDTNSAFNLSLISTSGITTADKSLTINVNDANRVVSLGGNLTTAGAFTTSGAFPLTLTQTASTNVTLPTTGTLSTLAGTETLTNKTLTSPVLNSVSTLTLDDTNSAFNLSLISTSGITTADKSLTINVNDANRVVSLGGNLTTADTFTTSGAFPLTLTQTASTNVILPTTGTLSTLAGAETLTNKTHSTGSVWNGSAITVPFGGTGATSLTGVIIGNGTSAFTTKTNPAGAFVGDTDTQTLTNKSLVDGSTLFVDDIDNTKRMQFQLTNVTAGTIRTLSVPDTSGVITLEDATQTLTNKTHSTGSSWIGSTITVPYGGSGATSLTGVLIGNGTSAFTTKTNPTGAFVGDTDTQTLTNKTLTAPVINGGTVDNATIGATTASTGRFTTISSTNTTNQIALGTTNITTLNYPAPVGAITLTFPNTTDTMVGRATTDTLTNKTLTSPSITGGTINNASIGATTASTGRFTTVAATNTTNQFAIGTTNITTLNYPASVGAITLTFPNTADTIVGRATTDTLTNKTLTSPVINGGTINNASVGATTASTGRFTTVAATNTTNQFAIGTTNITTLNYPASVGAVTLTFPNTTDTIVGRATTDTLTNKTLTLPVISSISNGGTVTIPSGTDTLMNLGSAQTITGVKTYNTAPNMNSLTALQAVVTDGSKNLASLQYTNNATVNTIASRDANANVRFNNSIEGYTTTVTAAGTTTLTVASTKQQIFTGVTTQTIVLPVTSTLVLGQSWTIKNNSTGDLTVNSSGSNLVATMFPSDDIVVTCINTGVTDATGWNVNTNGAATQLRTATGVVTISGSAAPTIGQTLTATSPTTATWQNASGGISSINSQTGATQTLTTGTAGTDFAISSATNTHTFNLPNAGASARGVVSTGAQTLAGSKTFSSPVSISATSNQLALGNTNILTLSSAQTTSQTLSIPNITTADSVLVSNVSQKAKNKYFYSDNTFTYSVGTAGMTGGLITGVGTSWVPGHVGGFIEFSNGVMAVLTVYNSPTSFNAASSETVANGTSYVIYFGNVASIDNYGIFTRDITTQYLYLSNPNLPTISSGYTEFTSNNAINTTLFISTNQTSNQNLSVPDITTNDTFLVSNTSQKAKNKYLYSDNTFTYSVGTAGMTGGLITGVGTSWIPGYVSGFIEFSNGVMAKLTVYNSPTSFNAASPETVANGTSYVIYFGNVTSIDNYGMFTRDITTQYLYLSNPNLPTISSGYTEFTSNNAINTTLSISSNQTTSLTLDIPDITVNDVFATEQFTQTLLNKSLVDNSTYIIDSTDATKRLAFNVDGATGTTLTLATSQSTSQILNLPNITSTDTAIVSRLPQTLYKKVSIGGQDASYVTLNTQLGPSITVPTNNACSNIAFAPDGLRIFVTNNANNSVRVYRLKLDSNGTLVETLTSTLTPASMTPTAITVSPRVGGTWLLNVVSSSPSGFAVYNSSLIQFGTTITLGTSPRYPSYSLDGDRIYVANNGSNNVSVINPSTPVVTATVSTGSPVGITVSSPVATASAVNGTEIYIANGNSGGGVGWFTGIPVPSTPAGTITTGFAGVTLRFMVADKQRNLIYANSSTVVYVVSTISKTVTNSITVTGATNITYSNISNDNTYLYLTDTTSRQIFMMDLRTLSTSLIINTATLTEPSTLVSAVVSPDNSSLFAVGSGASQIVSYDVKKSQYVAYSVGQASQSGDSVTGVLGTLWHNQMLGGIIVFEDGTTSDISFSEGTVITNNANTKVSRTVAQQNYTIYYRTTIVNANGSGIIGEGNFLMAPIITSPGDITNRISFDLSTSPTASEIIIKTSQTTSSDVTLQIPDLSGTDILMTTNTNQSIFGVKSFESLTVTDTNSQMTIGTTNLTVLNFPPPAGSVALTFPNTADTIVGRDTTDTLTNKRLSDTTTFIVSNVDVTKRLNVNVAGNTSGVTLTLNTAQTTATRTLTIPNIVTNSFVGTYIGTTAAVTNAANSSVAFGDGAVANGVSCTVFGSGATSSGAGQNNTCVGFTASVTSPALNSTSIGNQAVSVGTSCVTIGHAAQTNSNSSVAIGVGATTTGVTCTVVGANTSCATTQCTIVGASSTSAGAGTRRTIVGFSSTAPGLGNGQILLGSNTTAGAVDNIICLGNDITSANASTANSFYINSTIATNIAAAANPLYINPAGRIFTNGSSSRYKQNIQDLTNTAEILTLRPRIYNYRPANCGCPPNEDCDGTCKTEIGLIAEEVSALTNGRYVIWGTDPDTGLPREESVQYDRLVVPLIAEVRKLKQETQNLVDNTDLSAGVALGDSSVAATATSAALGSFALANANSSTVLGSNSNSGNFVGSTILGYGGSLSGTARADVTLVGGNIGSIHNPVAGGYYLRPGLANQYSVSGVSLSYSANGLIGPVSSTRRIKRDFRELSQPERILEINPLTYAFKKSICNCCDEEEVYEQISYIDEDGVKRFEDVTYDVEGLYKNEHGIYEYGKRQEKKKIKTKHVCKRELGAIAEEVSKVCPEVVVNDREGEPISIQYDRLALYLIPVVKEQKEKIYNQELILNLHIEKVSVLNDVIQDQQKQINELKELVFKLLNK